MAFHVPGNDLSVRSMLAGCDYVIGRHRNRAALQQLRRASVDHDPAGAKLVQPILDFSTPDCVAGDV